MSRITQYVGLTDAAKEWVKSALSKETNPKMTFGMFDEDVPGHIYHMPVPKGPNDKYRAVEELQTSPWSGGPMLFTHLHLFLTKECGQELDMDYAFSWVYNPGLDGEYDPEKAHYNV